MPDGVLVAWHRDMPGVPPLSVGWTECDGQAINAPGSLMDGLLTPNLIAPNILQLNLHAEFGSIDLTLGAANRQTHAIRFANGTVS